MALHVLIVEDNNIWAQEFANLLGATVAVEKCEIAPNTALALECCLRDRMFYDVVFLDIRGTRTPELTTQSFVEAIKANTYLMPVVVVTESPMVEHAQGHWDADFYWLKRQIPTERQPEPSKIERWKADLLSPVLRKVSAYQERKPLIFGQFESSGTVRKESTPDDNEIIRQCEFLEYVRTTEDLVHIHEHFPRVQQHRLRGEGTIYYEMPNYVGPSLRTVLFDRYYDEPSALWVGRLVVERVLQLLFHHLYAHRRGSGAELNEARAWYIEEYYRRRREFLDIVDQLHATDPRKAVLGSLLEATEIRMGERSPWPNIHTVLEPLRSSSGLLERLRCPTTHPIHGDLHFDNILVALPFSDWPKIMFLDPKGIMRGDVAIDIGKLLTSAHGEYDFIQRRLLRGQEYVPQNNVVWIRPFTFSSHQRKEEPSGASSAKVFREFDPVREQKRQTFVELHKYIIHQIMEAGWLSDDEDWQFRSYFAEALHLANMAVDQARKGVVKLRAVVIVGQHDREDVRRNTLRVRDEAYGALDTAIDCHIRAVERLCELCRIYGNDLLGHHGGGLIT